MNISVPTTLLESHTIVEERLNSISLPHGRFQRPNKGVYGYKGELSAHVESTIASNEEPLIRYALFHARNDINLQNGVPLREIVVENYESGLDLPASLLRGVVTGMECFGDNNPELLLPFFVPTVLGGGHGFGILITNASIYAGSYEKPQQIPTKEFMHNIKTPDELIQRQCTAIAFAKGIYSEMTQGIDYLLHTNPKLVNEADEGMITLQNAYLDVAPHILDALLRIVLDKFHSQGFYKEAELYEMCVAYMKSTRESQKS